jgi:NTE family protein
MMIQRLLALAGCATLLVACATAPKPAPVTAEAPPVVTPSEPPPVGAAPVAEPPQVEIVVPPPRIALVLGGGAARGFAHVGAIKALESQSIKPDIIVGTSVGSMVGALYASGYDGFELQRVALEMTEAMVSDWSLPNRGFLRGEALQEFVNRKVQNRPIEKLPRKLAIVATDLGSGEPIVFERGDTGMAVRASSSVPGVFQPVKIGAREYVDGGLVSPVPVKAARALGADIVIAVDISARPSPSPLAGTIDVLLQTVTIMGKAIAANELVQADVIVKPDMSKVSTTDFTSRHLAILEGERAGLAAMPMLRAKLAEREERVRAQLMAQQQQPGAAR